MQTAHCARMRSKTGYARIRLFPLLFENGCSQSSRFPTAGQGERSSGNEIGAVEVFTTLTAILQLEILSSPASFSCSRTEAYPSDPHYEFGVYIYI